MTERPKPALPTQKTTRKVQRPNGPPDWDFKKYGLLSSQDIDKAFKLKKEDRVAFKLSERAQAIVAWSEGILQMADCSRKGISKRKFQPFRDLSIASNRKLKPKKRLAAIERFKRLFGFIPLECRHSPIQLAQRGTQKRNH